MKFRLNRHVVDHEPLMGDDYELSTNRESDAEYLARMKLRDKRNAEAFDPRVINNGMEE
jgi:hypothetical protein